MDDFTVSGSALIEEAVDWLREHYADYEFWVVRDVVWTLQTHLRWLVGERGLPYLVLNDYPMLAGTRRALSADLVVRDRPTGGMVAAEFKYEPAHRRTEFMATPGKLPVVLWGAEGVAKDLGRIREFVEAGAATAAYAVFIDEGRYFRHRPAHPGSEWVDWDATTPGGAAPSVLWSRWPAPVSSALVDRTEVEPAPALPHELAVLREDVPLAIEDIDGAETHRAGGVEEPAARCLQDGEAIPRELRVKLQRARPGGRVPGPQEVLDVAEREGGVAGAHQLLGRRRGRAAVVPPAARVVLLTESARALEFFHA